MDYHAVHSPCLQLYAMKLFKDTNGMTLYTTSSFELTIGMYPLSTSSISHRKGTGIIVNRFQNRLRHWRKYFPVHPRKHILDLGGCGINLE
jgi:hypothetical protein